MVLSTAINKYMYISVMERFGNTFRISYSRTELRDAVEQIEHPIVRECLERLNLRKGLEIVSMAELPAETGMGSSSSFTVGLLHALHAFQGHVVTAEYLAADACAAGRPRIRSGSGVPQALARARADHGSGHAKPGCGRAPPRAQRRP